MQDSGGFQLVSLSKFTTITEEGAKFESPFTGEPTMLTVNLFTPVEVIPSYIEIDCIYQPEESISIQHAIGADIIMQLDDVGETLQVSFVQ
jgi:queuine tRNA-ribosyltransferase catalytic subunit